MKKFALVLLLIAAMASPAMAGQIQLGYASTPEGYFGMYKSSSGGEFTLNPLTGWLQLTGYAPGVTRNIGLTGTFQSFCLEGGTDIDGYPTTYNADLNTNAVGGGPGAPPAGDPVSVGTGWLYMQFATGTLAGYNWSGSSRLDSAFALQKTIWWLEGETGLQPANIFTTAVLNQFGSMAGAMANGGWNYGVYALNLWTLNGRVDAQDFLVFVPDGGATLMLLGGALMGLGALRRKFRA